MNWHQANFSSPQPRPPDSPAPALGAGLMTTAVKIFGRCNILEKPRFPPNYQGFSWPAQENVFRRN